jgi:penicillin amidase
MGWDLASGNLTADIFTYRLMKQLGPEKAGQLIPLWNTENNYVYPSFQPVEDKFSGALSFIASMDKLEDLGIETFSGSNNWAVSGKKSATGKPILSNDMHLGFGAPGIWMQIHEVIPGRLNVTGVTIPGQPFIVAGHNEKIAWGMTNLSVDDIDLFAERINPENSHQYYFNGEWRNMVLKDQIIKIKGEQPDTFQLLFTHRGPIISGLKNIGDAALSMRWSGYDKSDEIKSVYLLNRAKNWDDFRQALSYFRSVSQNFAYADTEGNIGLNTGGGIAIRKGPGSLIRDGETDEYDWKGYVPFEELPFTYNPPDGQVSSANNKTVDERYPYYIGNGYSLPYRINRIRQMLNEKEVLGIDDFKKMLLDQHSNYAALLTPVILKLQKRKAGLSKEESAALDLLADWDYDMNAELAAPSIFEFFRISFIKNLLADEIGDMFDQLPNHPKDYYIYRIIKEGPDEWVDNIKTPEKETLDDILLKSFKDCIADLTDRYGANQAGWKWGNIHKISLDHPLGSVRILDILFGFNSPKYPIGGSFHTVSPFTYGPGFKVNHGASERHIFNTADWDESYTIIPTGESGIPGSEFYLSQFRDYLQGRFYRDAFSEKAVKASTKYRLILKPS